MSVRRIVHVALWVLSIVATAQWSARAQVKGIIVPPVGAPPQILSGPDLGFRLQGQRDDTALGTLVVRIQGEWFRVVLPTNAGPGGVLSPAR